MSALKIYSLLLLVLPLLIVCSPVTSARRIPKGGCLSYGHSCLGAHGKRSSQSTHQRPLLTDLLEVLNTRPEVFASLSHPKDESVQVTDDYRRGMRYGNGRIVSTPVLQEEEEEVALPGPIMDDTNLFGLLGSRMNAARDVRMTSDGMDEGMDEGDALYLVNMDYEDDRVRRSAAVEKVATHEDGPKEPSDDWEQGKESRNHRKEMKDSNAKLRYFGTWLRR